MKKLSRRQFLKGSMMAGAYLAAGGAGALWRPRRAYAYALSPNLQKFMQPLRNPLTGGIPLAASDGVRKWGVQTATHYTIGISQYTDQLHPKLPPTKLWGYGQGGTSNYRHLGGILVTKRDAPVQITFQNNLPDRNIIPVDTTIPGADQAQNRTAVHIHGGFVPWISDGGPFDWWAPDGTTGKSFLNNKVLNPRALKNEAEYYYPNGQGARLVWYHDHAYGITRTNAYAGIASGYVITDAYEAVLASAPYYLPGPLDPRTLYLIFQDKVFFDGANDPEYPKKVPGALPGDLWYAHTYETPSRWDQGPTAFTLPDPSVIPEFYGDTILCNGTVYPYVEVEQRQYRLRTLNACNARFLNPRLYYANGASGAAMTEADTTRPGPVFIQIGSEGGFLPYPAYFNTAGQRQLLMAPAERADLIVDFRNVPAGSVLILYSDAPSPFPNGDTRNDFYPGNPDTPSSITGFGPNTRTLLQIRVKARKGTADPPIRLPNFFTPTDPFLIFQKPTVAVPYVPTPAVQMPFAATTDASGAAFITLANGRRVAVRVRQLTLNEDFDEYGRLIQYLGTNVATGPGPAFGRTLTSEPTEIVKAGSYEIWEIANLTGDTHPIHFHLVNVMVLSRQAFDAVNYKGTPVYMGGPTAPDFNELGWKETVRMNPGQVTRVLMKFDLPAVPFTVPASPRTGGNEYVWHCHILEHEEHDMMRPLVVV